MAHRCRHQDTLDVQAPLARHKRRVDIPDATRLDTNKAPKHTNKCHDAPPTSAAGLRQHHRQRTPSGAGRRRKAGATGLLYQRPPRLPRTRAARRAACLSCPAVQDRLSLMRVHARARDEPSHTDVSNTWKARRVETTLGKRAPAVDLLSDAMVCIYMAGAMGDSRVCAALWCPMFLQIETCALNQIWRRSPEQAQCNRHLIRPNGPRTITKLAELSLMPTAYTTAHTRAT